MVAAMDHALRRGLAALILSTIAASASAEPVTYGAAYLHSWHIGTDELNDNTPGLAIGRRWPSKAGSRELHVEGGVFWNSYEEIALILQGGVSWQLAEIGPGALRLGASAGTARYEEQSKRLEDAYGIPNLGGFIPIVAVTATYRVGATGIRLTSVPPDTDVTAIFNLSVAHEF
jgi:hypothetical protein